MPEFGFYHLTRDSLERALPRLLEKLLASGRRAVIRCSSAERLEGLDRALWSYEPASFLPHAGSNDAHYQDSIASSQPIWLTTGLDRPNDADVLILTEGAMADGAEAYERVVDMFDGEDEASVRSARERWKIARAGGHILTYWEQTPKGWRTR
ncbi:DNA polymerase III, chi subunit [Arboricoccus pini]|uniref:DNA polymerase III, chi subunit n=1 Tax=Arboricoccus pini TaxID=1963835 RepID=A0A212Q831_9PROT|nr:DNA polymerase III subunit chi [Arboricoccus pini]SNB55449.1 DNA polymerase III, chi subunit [Arboricoccus pini]